METEFKFSSGPDADIHAGYLLLSSPALLDPNFFRTVLLIVEHDDNGTFGLILNRKLDLTAGELAKSLDISWGGSESGPHVWTGGPVMPGTVWAVHDNARGIAVSRKINKTLSMSADATAVRALLLEPAGQYRIFLGYSGWSQHQLMSELNAGAWIVAKAPSSFAFYEDENLWENILQSNGYDPEG